MRNAKSLLKFLLATPASILFVAATSMLAHATTYTWTQTATGNQDWTTPGNWLGSTPFVSDAGNELMFFADTTAQLGAGAAGASQVVINVPTSLSMNTLTLNGKGPNSTVGAFITIGTSASTWTLGDGVISTVNLNSILGGGGADRDLRYSIGANLTLVGGASGITTFTGNSTSGIGAVLSGSIGESAAGKGITKSGASLLVFSGNNNYSGTTSVTGGVLRLASANALSGGIGSTGGTSALTLNGGVVELGAGDFSRGLGAGSSQFQITGGTSGFSAYGGPRVVTVNGDASLELQWGSTYFQPGALVLNQLYSTQATVYANGSIELRNKLDLNGATRTVQVNANKALISGDIRTSSGTAGLTKTGNGTLVLTGNNSYNGTTTISAGTLSIDSVNNIGGSGSSNLAMTGGTLQIRGTALTSLSNLDSTVTFSNTAKGFDIHNAANTFTVDQVLSGTGTGSTLTKSGVGTLVLNQNNTYAGATGANGGTLILDYTTNNGSKLSDSAALTLGGAALVLNGGSHTELVSSTTLNHQTGNSITRNGGTSQISLGALTVPGGSALYTLAIAAPGLGEPALAKTSTGNATGLTNATSILSLGRVTVGSHFAANDGSGNIVAYGDYATATTAGGSFATTISQLTGGGTMAAGLTSYALRIVNGGNSDVLDINSRNLAVSNNSTIFYAGGYDNNYIINGTTGALTSASGNQPFVINTYAGTTLTVNARVTSNLTNIQKAGEGTLVLGANSQLGDVSGPSVVQQGVLRLAHKDALGTIATGTLVQGGAALELSGGIDFAAEPLTLNGVGISNGGALRNQSGTNSFAGAITIGASGARINADASTTLTLTGGIVTTLTQDVTFGGAGNTTVSTAAISGSGSLIKDGTGTLSLTVNATYTGNTNVNAGALEAKAIFGAGNTTVAQDAQLTADSIQQTNLTLQGTALSNTGLTKIRASGSPIVNAQGDNSGASRVNTLSIATGGVGVYHATLDLQNNDLIVNNTTSANDNTSSSQLLTITDMVKAGFNGGLWNGKGITSSYISTQAPNLDVGSALGVMRNVMDPTIAYQPDSMLANYNPARYGTNGVQPNFDGFTLAGNETLVKYTYYGDADLDGKITSFDFALLDAGFAQTNQYDGKPGWFFGDFNYDGTVGSQDYALMNLGYIAFSSVSGNPNIPAGTQLPEPNTLILGAFGLAGLLSAHRRRQQLGR